MSVATIQQAFNIAFQHHQAGRLTDAEALYRQILAVQPDHADSVRLLGVIALQVGRHEMALDFFDRAVVLDANNSETYFNLSDAYCAMGRVADAVAAYRRALTLNPGVPEAHNNLGVLLTKQSLNDEAIDEYRHAIRLKPHYATAYSNLGVALATLGRLDEAIFAYRQALHFNWEYPQAHNNLGNALYERGFFEEAIAKYRQALALKPDYLEAHVNLAISLMASNQPLEAVHVCRQVLKLKPDYPEALTNLGRALGQLGHLDEAIAIYHQALEFEPENADLWNNFGHTLKDQGRVSDAIAAFRRAVKCKPAHAFAHDNLIYSFLYAPSEVDESIIEAQRRWNQVFSDSLKPIILPYPNVPDPKRRLRIGYASSEFRDHVTGRYLRPLFSHHTHRDFEITCYAGVMQEDALTSEFRRDADQWRNTVRMTDEAFVELIRQDGVDILVDLTQHMAGNRLPVFARKPTPVQASFAGYPESSGVEAIGFRISDKWLEPGGRLKPDGTIVKDAGHEHVYLIDSFWCYDPCGMELQVNELPAQAAGSITFGSLNNFCKVNEPLLALWAWVLKAVQGSRLIILSHEGSHRQRTLDFLESVGIAPHRVEFATPRPRKEYLELYHRIDIVLDTFPYNGHTTSLDALWMGVPVVSLCGERPVSRAGLSQLSNLGLPELVAFTEDQYVEIATKLANDIPRLKELRSTLRDRMEKSVLMDGPHFARQIEACYRSMWRQWCESQNT